MDKRLTDAIEKQIDKLAGDKLIWKQQNAHTAKRR
jgi:hypothetical protein